MFSYHNDNMWRETRTGAKHIFDKKLPRWLGKHFLVEDLYIVPGNIMYRTALESKRLKF